MIRNWREVPVPVGDGLPVRWKAAVLAALVALAACGKKQEQSGPPPVPVVVGQVIKGTVPLEVSSIGTVEAVKTVAVNARVGGELLQVFFEEGQFVKQGEPLFQIDPAPYRATLEGAQAALARDSVKAANVAETVSRYAELIEKEYVTRQQYDQMAADAESQKATVMADRANLETAGLNLGYCLIRSPLEGRTGQLLIHQGNIVKANSDNPLVVLHQIEPVYIRFTISEQYLTEVLETSRQGKLTVSAVVPGEENAPRSGTLDFVDNLVDESTGTITLKASFTNHDRLLWPGQFVNVALALRQIENAVVAPTRAVQTGQEGEFVFVVRPDSTVESRPVKVSYSHAQVSVIEQGLEGGETVVTDGHLRLFPGARIEIKQDLQTTEAEKR
ncbi:MAG: efflux RND transporter periplasmic adaptor subunit [Candidatus Glassbacteria bacterium]